MDELDGGDLAPPLRSDLMEFVDPEDLEALRDAIGEKVIHEYPLKLPNGKHLKLKIRQCGIAELMEASNGEKQAVTRSKTADFNSRNWRRQAIRKLNLCLIDWQLVDDLSGHRPNLSNRELPFSLIRGDEYNQIMELGFPGYLSDAEDIQDKVNELRNQPLQSLSTAGTSIRSSETLQSSPGGLPV